MYECKDCDHLLVCKYTDTGDGRCQQPKYFRDKHQLPEMVSISPAAKKALQKMGKAVHGGNR